MSSFLLTVTYIRELSNHLGFSIVARIRREEHRIGAYIGVGEGLSATRCPKTESDLNEAFVP